MMFFNIFESLCNEREKSPNAVAKELKIPSGSVSAWKSGTKPRIETISKIADYFGVSTDYLLGNTDIKEKPAADGSELLARLSDPKFRELVQILSTASDKDLDLLIELARRIDIGKQDA